MSKSEDLKSLVAAVKSSMKNNGKTKYLRLLSEPITYYNESPLIKDYADGRNGIVFGTNYSYFEMFRLEERVDGRKGIAIFNPNWNKDGSVNTHELINTLFHELQHFYYKLQLDPNKHFDDLSDKESSYSNHNSAAFSIMQNDMIKIFESSREGKKWIEDHSQNKSSALDIILKDLESQYTTSTPQEYDLDMS